MTESTWGKLQPLIDLASPWAVRVVATLRIPDLIADGVTRIEALAERSSADPETLGRVMRFLTARGVFDESEPGSFRLTPVGRLLQDGAGVRAWLDQDGIGGRLDRTWPALVETVRTGKPPYPIAFGRSLWEDIEANPPLAESYNEVMAQQAERTWSELRECYDWSRIREVVDVGGGAGTILAALAQAHPHLRGAVVELPAAAQSAAERFEREGLDDRCRALSGSMFDPLPKGADAYLLSIVINDWDEENAAAILRRCGEAAGTGGRILIVEPVLERDAASYTSSDLIMLMGPGSRARTMEQIRTIIETAGLQLLQVHSRPTGLCLFECATRAPERPLLP